MGGMTPIQPAPAVALPYVNAIFSSIVSFKVNILAFSEALDHSSLPIVCEPCCNEK